MSELHQHDIQNGLLAALSAAEFIAVQRHLAPVGLKLRDVLYEPGRPVTYVYFPESGICSMTLGERGNVETGIVGREGMVGISVALGVGSSPFNCFAQSDGEGFRLAAADLVGLLDECPTLRRLLLRYAHVQHVQAASTAIANAEYTVETRLARWLLMCHDRTDGNEITVTHEFLSVMLGVRRAGVTSATHVLEGTRAIRAERGLITVVDRPALERLADTSYGHSEAEHARLIVPEVHDC